MTALRSIKKQFAHTRTIMAKRIYSIRHTAPEFGEPSPALVTSRSIHDLAWRTPVGIFLIVSSIRGSELLVTVDTDIWLVAQFGSAALGLLWLTVTARPATPRGPVRIAVVSMAVLMAVVSLGLVTSIDLVTSATQLLLSVLMLSFVAQTLLSRWARQPTRVTGDLLFVSFTVTIVFLVSFGLLAFNCQSMLGAYGRFTGLLSNANYAGALGALVTVLLLVLLPKISSLMQVMAGGSIVVTTAAALASTSRSAILAMLVGVGIVLFTRIDTRWRRTILIIVVAAVCVIVTLFPIQLIRGDLSIPSAPRPSTTEPTLSEIPESVSPGAPSPTYPGPPPQPEESNPLVEGLADGPSVSEDPITTIDDQASGRLEIYRKAVAAWAASPILGTGFRTSPLVLDGVETHNLALAVLLETGLLGFAAFAAASFSLLLRFRDLWRSHRPRRFEGIGPVVVVLVIETALSSMFGWGGPTALLFWLVLAAFLVPQDELPHEVTNVNMKSTRHSSK